MELFRIFSDLVLNYFSFFVMDLFFCTFSSSVNPKSRKYLLVIYLIFLALYSVIPSISYGIIIIVILNYVYLHFVVQDILKKKIILFAKYYIFYYVASYAIYTIHTILTWDIVIQLDDDLYYDYKTLTCTAIVYILLSLYINSKRISSFRTHSAYKRRFNLIIALSIIVLSICSLLLGSTIFQQEEVLPLIFSLLMIITVLCLSAYRKVVIILEENALTRIQYEQNILQQEYYAHVEKSLKALSLLRHDFKSHLNMLDKYASVGKIEELHNYVGQIKTELEDAYVIQTPSPLLSSLLNAKREICLNNNIDFQLEQDFPYMEITDYHLVTILCNIIDNATTAAAKVKNGTVSLILRQVDSYLEIICNNNHCEDIQKRRGLFLTTNAQNKEIHGLGIASVQKSVDILGGKIDIQYTTDTFIVSVLVPNYK